MNNFNIGQIDNFAGNMGSNNVSGSISLKTEHIDEIRSKLSEINNYSNELIKAGADQNLVPVIQDALAEVASDQPNIKKLERLFRGVESALSGAAGNLIAAGAIAAVGSLLAMVG